MTEGATAATQVDVAEVATPRSAPAIESGSPAKPRGRRSRRGSGRSRKPGGAQRPATPEPAGAARPQAAQVAEGRRVAILDYDAHHGNGTSEIFSDEASVLYISTHQYGIYPGTGPAADVGEGDGRGFTVNIPITAGCGDSSYFIAYDALIEPILREFKPEAILMSLGIDAHYRDPLTSLALSSPGYVELVARSAAAASSLCNGRLVVALEGGYHLDAV
ncbi:MAG: hypothetical protein AABX97_10490, partial [Candidatus Thermoplasmatota archaeon]